jgi:putative Mn2+ efflux pump MntP
MGLPEIIIIAIGLSMDAFAVSIILGLSTEKLRFKEAIIPGLYFGIFQALMPCIGYFAGINFASKIQQFEHWIAFVILGFIGGKMIKDSFSKKEDKVDENPFKFVKMLVLAIATSIDALAVGITFSFFKINIFIAIAIIGFTTFIISICGVIIGKTFGAKFKSKAELVGGVILVGIGVKIVIEHLFFMK